MDDYRQSEITVRINADTWMPWGATVLIIDDDLDIRLLVRIVLESASFTIAGEASNGVDGLRLWRGLDGPANPDVVILDNNMPGMAGLEVAALILEERPSQIIVMCTSFLNHGIETEAAELGVACCLPKRDITLLPTVVQRCISNGRGGSRQEPRGPGGDGSDSDLLSVWQGEATRSVGQLEDDVARWHTRPPSEAVPVNDEREGARAGARASSIACAVRARGVRRRWPLSHRPRRRG